MVQVRTPWRFYLAEGLIVNHRMALAGRRWWRHGLLRSAGRGLSRDARPALLVSQGGSVSTRAAHSQAGDSGGMDERDALRRFRRSSTSFHLWRKVSQGHRETEEGPRGVARLLRPRAEHCTCARPTRSSRPSPQCTIAPLTLPTTSRGRSRSPGTASTGPRGSGSTPPGLVFRPHHVRQGP